jgi:primosomal protein N'
MLKSASPKALSDVLSRVRASGKKASRRVKLIIDVDPVYML